ncbi:MAG: type II/IV secretion system protein, partial [Pseudomonadales bacterium]|nr:type II/IV secretion system protein [Pseudomonadales bacterium]
MNSSKTNEQQQPERFIDLRNCLNELVRDGLIDQRDANFLSGSPRGREEALLHPLTYIGNKNLDNLKEPGKKLDEETLTRWLAEKAGQPYFNIDPLDINVSAVTEVVSFAYAKRHQLLCVGVTKDLVTIATAQPWVRSWEEGIEHISRRRVRRVVAKPSDIQRYMVEFYSLAKSVSSAVSEGGGHNIGIGNFEQLLELEKLKDPDANDQHIINIVDWLLQYAFEQRASDIHIEPRRELGKVRFRIDGV